MAEWEVRLIGYWDHRDQYAIMDGDVEIAKVSAVDPDPDYPDDEERRWFGPQSHVNAALLASAQNGR